MHKKPHPCVSGIQPRVNNPHSKQYCDSIDSICSKNHFEVLSVEDCVSAKCNASVILDLKGDRQRHTSNTVNVKKQKHTVNKGKNVVHLFTGGACRIRFTNLN